MWPRTFAERHLTLAGMGGDQRIGDLRARMRYDGCGDRPAFVETHHTSGPRFRPDRKEDRSRASASRRTVSGFQRRATGPPGCGGG
jgi:hypothetical protein